MKKYILINVLLYTSILISNELRLCSLYEMLKTNPNVIYTTLQPAQPFFYKFHPISPLSPTYQPRQGIFAETFVLEIPNGKVCSKLGWVLTDNFNSIIKELIPQQYPLRAQIQELLEAKQKTKILHKISGRVAVITRKRAECYGHLMSDILGRLVLLDMHNIPYDWLYMPIDTPYMKQLFELWGVADKIIQPYDQNYYLEAETLIVPSQAFRRIPCKTDPVTDVWSNTHFWPQWMIDYTRAKLLPIAQEHAHEYHFSKKIFISRNDAHRRKIINENAIFDLFKEKGFVKYCPGKMSVLEQIILFSQADFIVAANGSSLSNLMFCKPRTTVVEIFQNRADTAFYNLAQHMNCNYHYIATVDFPKEEVYIKQTGMQSTKINLEKIKIFLKNNDL